MTYQEKRLALLLLKVEDDRKGKMIGLVIETHLLKTEALPHDWRRQASQIVESSPGIPGLGWTAEQLMDREN